MTVTMTTVTDCGRIWLDHPVSTVYRSGSADRPNSERCDEIMWRGLVAGAQAAVGQLLQGGGAVRAAHHQVRGPGADRDRDPDAGPPLLVRPFLTHASHPAQAQLWGLLCIC